MRIITTIALFAFLFAGTSCVREGCTDEEAINYNAEADDDDGSCVYAEEVQEDRRTYEFEIEWDDGFSYQKWEVPVGLENRSVLLYTRHPSFSSEEWVAMPFTHDGESYYFSEEAGDDVVWVYVEDDNGNAALTNGETTEHKAVVLQNEFLKENPEVKDMQYEEMEASLD